MKGNFLFNFIQIEQKLFSLRWYWIMFNFKFSTAMIKLIYWRLKWEKVWVFPFLVYFSFFFFVKTFYKVDNSIRCLILWLTQTDISFISKIYENKFLPFKVLKTHIFKVGYRKFINGVIFYKKKLVSVEKLLKVVELVSVKDAPTVCFALRRRKINIIEWCKF